MCGLYGALAGTHRPTEEEARRACASMARRGPDGEGLWSNGENTVVLGHRRLAIIDLSASGVQPLVSNDERFTIVFNGEIYNYLALRDYLESHGVSFKTNTDTEVIVELYRTHGCEAFPLLRGMFALALWDNLRKEMVLARDPIGIKPLYYTLEGGCLRFASQVKALLAATGSRFSPEPAGHVGFWLWGHVPEPYTLYEGILSFPAGCFAIVKSDLTFSPKPFENLPRALNRARRASPTLDLAAATRDTVLAHLTSDVPVGIFLSSGRDSTTLAAIAAEVAQVTLSTLTVGFREFVGTKLDEVPLAEALAARFGWDHHTTWVTGDDFRSSRNSFFAAMDQPTVDGLNTFLICQAGRSSSSKVMLSGLGADELFGGYPSFSQLPLLRNIGRFLPQRRALGAAVRQRLRKHLPAKHSSLIEFSGSLGECYLLRRALHLPWQLFEILDPDFAGEGLSRLSPTQVLDESISEAEDDRTAVTTLEMCFYMRDRLLRDSDWASMASSLELRVPFADMQYIQDSGGARHTKAEMAATPKLPLPRAIIKRAKSGFAVPIANWTEENATSRAGVGDLRVWAKQVYCEFGGQLRRGRWDPA